MNAFLTDLFISTQGWLFDRLVQPVLFALGLAGYVEMGFEGIEFVLMGVLELGIAYTILRPLEAFWPAEQWSGRKAVRVDVMYTLLNRLGIIPVVVFALLAPLGATLVQLAISRAREYVADETAARLTGDPAGLASALERLSRSTLHAQELPQPAAAPLAAGRAIAERALKLNPNLAQGHALRGAFLLRQGEQTAAPPERLALLSAAQESFAQALASNPSLRREYEPYLKKLPAVNPSR